MSQISKLFYRLKKLFDEWCIACDGWQWHYKLMHYLCVYEI